MTNTRGKTTCHTSRRAFLKGTTAALSAWTALRTRAIPGMICASGEGTSIRRADKKRVLIIEVAAGEYDRQGCPAFLPLPESWGEDQRFILRRADTGEPVDVQIHPGPSPRLVWLIRDILKAGQTRRYCLAPGSPAPPTSPALTCDDGRSLIARVGGRPALQYNSAIVSAPNPQQSVYERSGYLYPLYNPFGQAVTDDFPPDHLHQHSVWFAWSKAALEGNEFNCWELSEGKGTIEHDRMEESGGGAVFAHFTCLLRHVVLDANGGRKTALHETWKMLVYSLMDAFVFDVELTQTCATESPVQVLENSYGGLAVRGHRNWFDVRNSDYLTSEGKSRKNGNQTRPRWVDLYGWVEGKLSGICVLDHPDNFRFPQPVRLHPEKPYFCFAPPALGPFSIEPGRPYRSRYRFYIHAGHPDSGVIDSVWNDFAHPAQCRIVSAGQ